MTVTIGRRELLAALGGAAAWPLAPRAQQPDRMRLIGVLMAMRRAIQPRSLGSRRSGLRSLGWDGRKAAMSGLNYAGAALMRIG